MRLQFELVFAVAWNGHSNHFNHMKAQTDSKMNENRGLIC